MFIRSPEVLALSVYGPESGRWFRLQHEFLASTTSQFRHAIYLNGCNRPGGRAVIVGESHEPASQQQQHLRGLLALLEYARKQPASYYLFLDCDCFPIRGNWLNALLRQMQGRSVAAAIRTENLDIFLHPCVVFTTDIEAINFKILPQTNLLGQQFRDVTCVATDAFPLLRTNRTNHHAVAGGIYYDLFYHHCCGSRRWGVRSYANGYYRDDVATRELMTKQLFEDPKSYLSSMVTKPLD